MLAVTLGHVESVRILLNHEANVNCENADGWTGIYKCVSLILIRNYKVIVCISSSRSCGHW